MKAIGKKGFFKTVLVLILLVEMSGRLWAYESIPVEKGGISGIIRFKGEAPVMPPRRVIHDTQFCGETMADDTYAINSSTHGLQNAVISIEGISQGKNHSPSTIPLSGLIYAQCDAHTFMKGNIVVFDHPYFTVTDQEGFYKITDIPYGKYQLKIWHAGSAIIEKEISIRPLETIDLSTELTAK